MEESAAFDSVGKLLAYYIRTKFENNLSAFARAADVDRQRISEWVRDAKQLEPANFERVMGALERSGIPPEDLRKLRNLYKPNQKNFRLKHKVQPFQIGSVASEVLILCGNCLEPVSSDALTCHYDPTPELLYPEVEHFREERVAEQREKAESGDSPGVFFDGPNIRLHNFRPTTGEGIAPELFFRPCSWFDYSISNQYVAPENVHEDGESNTTPSLLPDTAELDATRAIQNIKLSNLLTVTTFVCGDNWVIIRERSNQTSNAQQRWACSSDENIHRWADEPSIEGDFWSTPNRLVYPDVVITKMPSDYQPKTCPNPFFTAARGISEELSPALSQVINPRTDISFLAILWDLYYYNPHLVMFVRMEQSQEEVRRLLNNVRGTDRWEATPTVVPLDPIDELKGYLLNGQWSNISKGAILAGLSHYFQDYYDLNRKLL